MTTRPDDRRFERMWRDLPRVLDDLARFHQELLGVLNNKLTAMKQSDFDKAAELGRQEADAIRRIQEREGFRRQWLENMAPVLGVTRAAAKVMRVSQLVTFGPVDQRSAIASSARSLREVVEKVGEVNRRVARLSSGVLKHVAVVLASVGPKEAVAMNYSPGGIGRVPSGSLLLETVG